MQAAAAAGGGATRILHAAVTRSLVITSLAYIQHCGVLGLLPTENAGLSSRVIEKYQNLDLYSDATAALAALKPRKLAILSNGSPDMLNALVRNSGLDSLLDATISVDAKKIFKPSPQAYELIGEVLGTTPGEVLFVSSNPWDVAGAKAFGLNVAWIERITPDAMALACVENELVAPLTMFKAIRTQMDELGFTPDYRVRSLSELPGIILG